VQGSSARQTSKTENTPVDCTVFAIVDTIEKGGKIVFKKSSDKFQD
jgi:microcompartment protein CcmK/EutM